MSNECREIRDQIADLLADLLPERETRRVQEHCGACPDCRRYVQALREEDASLARYFARIDAGTTLRQQRTLRALESGRTKRSLNNVSMWREIMRNRYSKWATAAAVLIVAAVSIVFLDKSAAPAYALTDLPKAFAQAQVIHVQGWLYFPEHRLRDGRRIPPVQIDNWIDEKNSRSRSSGAGLSIDSDHNAKVIAQETISDGPYQMHINHADKSTEFLRVSEYRQRLETYRTSEFVATQLFGQIRELANSVIVGHEEIDGVAYDIWQSDVMAARATRTKHWLSASNGRLARAQILRQTREGAWELQTDYQTIEYDVPIPEGTFALEPPEGYTATNSKETAVPLELGGGSVAYADERCNLQCNTLMIFALSDGSVILGWRSLDSRSQQPKDLLFRDLTLGGPLPKLPVEIHGLKPTGAAEGVTYTGYHLAWTRKGDRFSEWSLYIPNGAPSPNARTLGYSVLYRFNLDHKPRWIMGLDVGTGIPIETAEDFDAWVRGAMAELSDSGTPPPEVTYQKIVDLARQIRNH